MGELRTTGQDTEVFSLLFLAGLFKILPPLLLDGKKHLLMTLFPMILGKLGGPSPSLRLPVNSKVTQAWIFSWEKPVCVNSEHRTELGKKFRDRVCVSACMILGLLPDKRKKYQK